MNRRITIYCDELNGVYNVKYILSNLYAKLAIIIFIFVTRDFPILFSLSFVTSRCFLSKRVWKYYFRVVTIEYILF